MIKTLILQRTHASSNKARTFGTLTADGVEICKTLEDQVREVPGQPVASWKIKTKTAIPVGVYPVTLVNSPKFGPDTLSVGNVPGFEFIRMHAGNTDLDTEGCPLLGMRINDAGIVGGTSRPAVSAVKAVVQQWLREGSRVMLDVRQIPNL